MKTSAATSRDFISTLRNQPQPELEGFVATVEKTREVATQATRPSVFERALDRLDADKPSHIPLLIGGYLGAVFEWAVRGHGAMSGQLSGAEARKVLAAGYDKLEGLEKQLVGHMITRVRYGADNSFLSSPLGYDEKSAKRFTEVSAELARLPPDQLARIDTLANKVEGALGMAWSATHGFRTVEEARADVSRQPPSYSADARHSPDVLQAITEYAGRVFDAAYAHARAQQQHDQLFTKGR